MSIPGFLFSCDFREPVVIIQTPSACKRYGDRDFTYDAGGYSHADVKTYYIRHKMAKFEVANLCSRNPTPREMESTYEKLKMEEEHRSDSDDG